MEPNQDIKKQIAELPPESVWVWGVVNGVEKLFVGKSLIEVTEALRQAQNP